MTEEEFEQVFAAYICGLASRDAVIAFADDRIRHDRFDTRTEFLSLSGSLSEKNFRLGANLLSVDRKIEIGKNYVLGLLSVKYQNERISLADLVRCLYQMENSEYVNFDPMNEFPLFILYEEIVQLNHNRPFLYGTDILLPAFLKKYECYYWASTLNTDWIVV